MPRLAPVGLKVRFRHLISLSPRPASQPDAGRGGWVLESNAYPRAFIRCQVCLSGAPAASQSRSSSVRHRGARVPRRTGIGNFPAECIFQSNDLLIPSKPAASLAEHASLSTSFLVFSVVLMWLDGRRPGLTKKGGKTACWSKKPEVFNSARRPARRPD